MTSTISQRLLHGQHAAPGRTLLVASTGGHLDELYRLSRRMVPDLGVVEWATFDDAQSRSLLTGEKVHYVEFVPPRGYSQAIRNVVSATAILREGRYDQVVSTGAGVAVPFVVAARTMGIPCHYVESAARSEGPSLTGRVTSRIPGVRLYTQYAAWADSRWQHRGSLFDDYLTQPRADVPPVRSVVVTLGTMRTYSFRSAIEALVAVLPHVVEPDAEVLWQVGCTDVWGLGLSSPHDRVPAADLVAAVREADLVVAHAGIGSALTALDCGHRPVLLPRRASRGEHVDDHQLMIARELDERGLAVSRDPMSLDKDAIMSALAARVLPRATASSYALTV